jgi:hypothetical protein
MPGHKNWSSSNDGRSSRLVKRAPLDRYFKSFVTGPLPTGGETLATPAPVERHSPERDVAGRQGAGDGQHLYAVTAEVVDLVPFIAARRRGRIPSLSRPAGGSAA